MSSLNAQTKPCELMSESEKTFEENLILCKKAITAESEIESRCRYNSCDMNMREEEREKERERERVT